MIIRNDFKNLHKFISDYLICLRKQRQTFQVYSRSELRTFFQIKFEINKKKISTEENNIRMFWVLIIGNDFRNLCIFISEHLICIWKNRKPFLKGMAHC